MFTEPQKEHHWLHQLVGEWTYESECSMGPDKPAEKFKGTESMRSIGGLWVQGESHGEMPGGGLATMVITLGYDPRKERYVGAFIGSMMTHLWIYEGTLDAEEKVLTLNTEGPGSTGSRALVKYQDVIEIKRPDLRLLTSYMLGDDGEWHPIMQAEYNRKR